MPLLQPSIGNPNRTIQPQLPAKKTTKNRKCNQITNRQMKQIIAKINQELQQITQRKKDLENAITALQKICHHQFEPAGHTHHKIEKCSECGMEISL
jgi:hypothetical protein